MPRRVASWWMDSGDFSDYLIGATATRAGAATTYTFDRALRRAGGFDLPG